MIIELAFQLAVNFEKHASSEAASPFSSPPFSHLRQLELPKWPPFATLFNVAHVYRHFTSLSVKIQSPTMVFWETWPGTCSLIVHKTKHVTLKSLGQVWTHHINSCYNDLLNLLDGQLAEGFLRGVENCGCNIVSDGPGDDCAVLDFFDANSGF